MDVDWQRWIPAPPTSSPPANFNLQDNVVGGDVNITHNNSSDIIAGIEHLLKGMGFSGQSSPAEQHQARKKKLRVLEISEKLAIMASRLIHGLRLRSVMQRNLQEKHSAQQHCPCFGIIQTEWRPIR